MLSLHITILCICSARADGILVQELCINEMLLPFLYHGICSAIEQQLLQLSAYKLAGPVHALS